MTELQQVSHNLYLDIHKGIRRELFALTERAGSVDPSVRSGRVDLAEQLDRTVEILVGHAHHEDTYAQPSIESFLPDLAAEIEGDHERIEGRMVRLQEMAYDAINAMQSAQRFSVHRLYIELASFTSEYLAHQDLEERLVMPALEQAIGVEAVLGIHGAIVGSIPPDQMAQALALDAAGAEHRRSHRAARRHPGERSGSGVRRCVGPRGLGARPARLHGAERPPRDRGVILRPVGRGRQHLRRSDH